MRRVISLGLCALFLLTFAGSAVADNVDECNTLKKKNIEPPEVYVPSLYGLCVAWHNASANADETALIRITEKYAEKSDGGSIPGSGGTNPDPDPPFECLCWTGLNEQYVCDLGEPILNTLMPIGEPETEFEDVFEGIVIFINSDGDFEQFGVPAELNECAHLINGAGSVEPNLTPVQGIDCGFEIGVIATFKSSGLCPVGG